MINLSFLHFVVNFLLIKTCWLLFCSFFIALMLLTFICGLAHNSSEVDLVTHKYGKKEKEWLKKKMNQKMFESLPTITFVLSNSTTWPLAVLLWLLYKAPFFFFFLTFIPFFLSGQSTASIELKPMMMLGQYQSSHKQT